MSGIYTPLGGSIDLGLGFEITCKFILRCFPLWATAALHRPGKRRALQFGQNPESCLIGDEIWDNNMVGAMAPTGGGVLLRVSIW